MAFVQAVSRPDGLINLAEAALLIAKEEYPALDVGVYLRRLDAMAEAVRARIGACRNPGEACAELNEHLFRREGFRGNTEEYHDPRNSFLSEVLDRRRGIPITLSSDAHHPEQIARHYQQAVAVLKKTGYRQITTFRNRNKIPLPI